MGGFLKKFIKVCIGCSSRYLGDKNRKFCSPHCFGVSRGFKKGQKPWNNGTKGVMPIAWNKGQRGRMSWHDISGLNHGIPWNKGKKYATVSIKHQDDYRMRRLFRIRMQKQVFKRDNYTCQMCGARGVDLQVDHIQSWAEYVDLRFNMENCRTLCVKCHYRITFGRPMSEKIRGWGHNLLKARVQP